MPFPRRLLIEGEELVLDLRPHPIALARAVLVTIAVIVAWIVISPTCPIPADILFWVTVGGGLVLFVLWPVRDFVRYITSHFVVTSTA
jgi:hypothetical protein